MEDLRRGQRVLDDVLKAERAEKIAGLTKAASISTRDRPLSSGGAQQTAKNGGGKDAKGGKCTKGGGKPWGGKGTWPQNNECGFDWNSAWQNTHGPWGPGSSGKNRGGGGNQAYAGPGAAQAPKGNSDSNAEGDQNSDQGDPLLKKKK